MKNYIVRNCPALLRMSKVCDDYRTTRDNPQLCKDITDCVMKRIGDKCYKATHEDLAITADYKKTACDVAAIYGRAGLADEILELLEIEEVE